MSGWTVHFLALGALFLVGPRAGGLVVSVDPHASQIGADVLHRGGNAVDAAVATAFALAVVHPEAGNVGGGGFLLAHSAKSGETFVVDYRETAPNLATPEMFLRADGSLDEEKAAIGWLTVGVPGTVHGLWTAHRRAGRLEWRELVDPAVRLALDGFVVDDVLARSLAGQVRDFKRFGEPARVFFPKGRPPRAGERLALPDLAATLTRIRDHGPAGFYDGPTALALDAAMREAGGLVRKEDLAEYRAKAREPVRGTYRGFEIASVGPPSSGGVLLIEMLNILEGYDLRKEGPGAATTLHWMAEAMRRAYYDRAKHLGDADFVDVPVDRLTSKEYAAQVRRGIGERAGSSAELGRDVLIRPEGESTTHFSVIDEEGNVVSNTYTLEGSYGAKVMAPGTGFLLNNEMHDFNTTPGLTDAQGRIGTPPNAIAPGKRMLSSQTPSIVLREGRPILVLGSPGGRTIPNTVLQVVVNVIDFGMTVQEAVDAPRMHHQWMPDVVVLEKRFGPEAARGLEALGHAVTFGERQGDCHAIWVDPATGEAAPGVDRRIRGAAAPGPPDAP
jgi:gamma-glutamyltranspeptidase/glutathione hydrolase